MRTFIPADLAIGEFEELEPYYKSLLERPVKSAGELEQWLADLSELTCAVEEDANRRYIDKTCHTDDKRIEERFLHYVEKIEPRIKPLFFALQKKFLESPHRAELKGERHVILEKRWKADVELFREENVALETEITKLNNEYDKLSGAVMVTFRGQEHTPPQMQKFIEDPDRPTRQEAWEAMTRRRLQDREAMDGIFDQEMALRSKIAKNAGVSDYRAYMWKTLKRFDYTPAQCESFARAIEKACVPVVRRNDEKRAQMLKVDRLRPWDLGVDAKGRPPLAPFGREDVDALVSKTKAIFDKLSPELAREFETLRANSNLDLDSRKGKAPGGYQISLEKSKQPFIFMNAAGLQRDVETLLHEGGHAFHYLWASQAEPLVFLRSAPMEFCEVASMSMELLGSKHFDEFYNDADAQRAKRRLLEGIIEFLPWMATIDSFQHWLYTHPAHTRAERTGQWLELMGRFGRNADWSGWEGAKESSWQRQLHLFHLPFYYVEYGIAQLGALQMWLKSKADQGRALSHYRQSLTLGGTRSLPELFTAADLRFDLSDKTLHPLMDAIEGELQTLPA